MQNFQDIIGQNTTVHYLQSALRAGSVSHAYILSGERGTGKKMLAKILAASLLCEDPQTVEGGDQSSEAPQAMTGDGKRAIGASPQDGAIDGRQDCDIFEPCGKCLSCIQAQDDSHPDILVLEREKPGSIGVGEIRCLRADMKILPYRGSRKVTIIPDAQLMTPQAQNALLKTLEEPPSYGVLLLLAEGTEAFLPTVLSRCITLGLRPVDEGAIEQLLIEKRGVEPARARICARFARGAVGKAIELAQDEAFAGRLEMTAGLLSRIETATAAEIIELVTQLAGEGWTEIFLDLLDTWYRDVLVMKSTGSAERLIFAGEIQYIKDAAQTLSFATLQRISGARAAAGQRLKARGNTELVLELLLLQIRQACRRDRRVAK